MLKKLFFILFLSSCLFAQAPIIYHSAFAINKSWWKLIAGGGNVDTVTSLYGIHSKGESKMLHYSTNGLNELSLTKNLRLKANRPYSFTFYYNRVSGSIADTIGLRPDTIFYYPTTYSPGCTKIIVPSTPQGISDANWRKITFTQTPTTTAPVYLAMRVTLYEESFIDSVVIRGDTTSHFFNFKSPSSGSVTTSSAPVVINWRQSQRDSSSTIVIGKDTVIVTGDSTYTWTPPDSTFNYSIIGWQNHFPTEKDSISKLLNLGPKSLKITAVNLLTNRIEIVTASRNVDSLKYYIETKKIPSWIYLGFGAMDKTYSPNITTATFSTSGIIAAGDTLTETKVVEKRDTTGLKPAAWVNDAGNMWDGRISYYGAVIPPASPMITSLFETGFVWDPCSGWCPGEFGYPGAVYMTFDSTTGFCSYARSFSSTECTACCMPNPPRLLLVDGTFYSEGIYRNSSLPGGVVNSIYSQAVNSLIYKTYRYRFDYSSKKIFVDDLQSGNSYLYYDLSLFYVSKSSGWTAPFFVGNQILIGIYLFPFEFVYDHATGSGSTIWSLAPCSQATTTALYHSISNSNITKLKLPATFQPMLALQDIGGFSHTIMLPLPPPADHSPILTDTFIGRSGFRIKIAKSFRGIYPKAIISAIRPEGH